jgi:hypothetical protein
VAPATIAPSICGGATARHIFGPWPTLSEAREAERQALATRKAAWAEGKAAAKEDAAVGAAGKKVEMLTARAEYLRPLAASARQKADALAARLLRETRAALAEEMAGRHRRGLARLYEALAGPLGEVLAAGLALDALH